MTIFSVLSASSYSTDSYMVYMLPVYFCTQKEKTETQYREKVYISDQPSVCCIQPRTFIALFRFINTKLPASMFPQIVSTCFATFVFEACETSSCARRMISSLLKEDNFSASYSNRLKSMDFSKPSNREIRGHKTCLNVLLFLSPGKQSNKMPALKHCFSI